MQKPKFQHLTPEQKALILQRNEEKAPARGIAEELQVNVWQVHRVLRAANAPRPRLRAGACYRNDAIVREMASEGCSISEIARRIGTNNQRVREYIQEFGIPYSGFRQVGENNPFWKGGRVVDKSGYVLLRMPDHPDSDRRGYVREHRYVMEQQIGRRLKRAEVVHHKDGDRGNNHPDNLELFSSNSQHLAVTLKDQVPNWTEEGKANQHASRLRQRDRAQKSNPSA